uniref:Uncharacterized protein n=1 Tax=Anguilla anguilla TaxID=7936 RepID=A0A0E9QKP2_ANGAN
MSQYNVEKKGNILFSQAK